MRRLWNPGISKNTAGNHLVATGDQLHKKSLELRDGWADGPGTGQKRKDTRIRTLAMVALAEAWVPCCWLHAALRMRDSRGCSLTIATKLTHRSTIMVTVVIS